MGAIAEAILLMIGLVALGTRTKQIGLKHYLVIFLVTLAQLAIFVWFMYTYEQPALH